MVRAATLCTGLVVIVGAAFVTGASVPPKADDGAGKQGEAKAAPGQKIGFFNIAKVMQKSTRATKGLEELNAERKKRLAAIEDLKDRYTKKQRDIDAETDAAKKAKLGQEIFQLSQEVEKLNHDLNAGELVTKGREDKIIIALHDELRSVAAELSRERGLSALLAYPDASSPEEEAMTLVKQKRLTPPAATPFYLDPKVDYTDDLIKRLNDKFAADGGK